ncbi:lytic transglycosylase domain-containing protein [Clostridium sp. LIBA-8841]|uniref:lytic transglycosylase domain-containing protein n=1 Tax=Clostridium sp. LIBA-8841 TaxID=2987530 RepID=UPI002AC76F1C|nr:lytic transglycosylase domain-containing protein [Clostridium sp. LIBA-8841]MDZ5252937.1 lytic transglycosylase domain-containing protein [Clostridium sp. LIBA-8841]
MKKIIRLVIIVLAIYLLFLGSGYILRNVVFPLKYMNYVERYSKEYDLDPYFVLAVMKAESNFNEEAKSNKDARGLMQITTSTGKWIAEQQGIIDFNTDLLSEPEVNIRFGCWYLNNLHEEFNNWDLVIAAYNAGRGRVQEWLSSNEHSNDGKNLTYIPFKETDKYVKKVNVYYNIYRSLYT